MSEPIERLPIEGRCQRCGREFVLLPQPSERGVMIDHYPAENRRECGGLVTKDVDKR